MSTTTYALDEVVLNFVTGGKILDVGCGLGRWGHLIRVHLQVEEIESEIIGIDIEKNYLRKTRYIYDHTVRCDAAYLPFRQKCFDTVLASAIIEHLPRTKGLKLISECERTAKKVVIITTPSPRTIWGSPEHISLWKPYEFRRIGYKVFGVRSYPRLVSTNMLFKLVVAFITGPLSYWMPLLSSYVVAVKILQLKVPIPE